MGRVSQRQNGEKMRLGVKQVLTVVKLVDFGVYLGSDEERVLLPKKQVPDGIELGDPIEVFLYKDSSDRMIATTNEPKIALRQLPGESTLHPQLRKNESPFLSDSSPTDGKEWPSQNPPGTWSET